MAHIYVDADACPVVKQIEIVAKSHNIPVTLFCDTNHVLKSDYSEVKIIGAGADAVDFAPVNSSRVGDIVVTRIMVLRLWLLPEVLMPSIRMGGDIPMRILRAC